MAASWSAVVAMAAVAAVVAMLHTGVAAPAPAPESTGLDCTQSFFNMTGCLTFVETGSKLKVPEKDCCPELAGLYDSNPICLCVLLNDGAKKFGISIDVGRALKLPGICHIDTLSVSLCSDIGIPVASPALVPASPSSSSSSPSQSPSGNGPKLPGKTNGAPPPENKAADFGTANLAVLAGASFVVAVATGIF